jgi:hypothetical protein
MLRLYRRLLALRRDHDALSVGDIALADAEGDVLVLAECAMLFYARYRGEWNDHRKSCRWQNLGGAARQIGLIVDQIELGRFGLSRDERLSRNQGRRLELWFGTKSRMTLMPQPCAASEQAIEMREGAEERSQ